MALRATYYGLKRKFARKINIDGVIPDAAGSNNPLITQERYLKLEDFVEVTGSRNILPPSPITSRTDQGITFTVETSGDFAGCVTLSGTNSGTSAAVLRYNITLQPGSYRLFGRVNSNIWVGLYTGSAYKWSTNTSDGVAFTINETTTYGFTIRVGGPVTITPDISMISPMIIRDFDPNQSSMFATYALSNRDLTLENIDQAAILDEHKTIINAIISAATGAADFAAFKTAMEALTPLTRSVQAPAERSLQVEEPVEDTPKKITKKSTKKEDS